MLATGRPSVGSICFSPLVEASFACKSLLGRTHCDHVVKRRIRANSMVVSDGSHTSGCRWVNHHAAPMGIRSLG